MLFAYHVLDADQVLHEANEGGVWEVTVELSPHASCIHTSPCM